MYGTIVNAFGNATNTQSEQQPEQLITGEDDTYIYKRIKKPPTQKSMVEKVKMSVPLVRMAHTDLAVRTYLLWFLTELNRKQNMPLIIPSSMRVEQVPDEQFSSEKVHSMLSGGANASD